MKVFMSCRSPCVCVDGK